MSLPETVPPEGLEETPLGSMPAGTLLGNYELGRMLGRGGMGAVYEARHRGVNKRVAVKVLLPHLAASKSSTQRFLREAEAAGRVRHPHTVDVTDVGVSEGIPYLVMELLEGQNLCDRLEEVGPLPIDAAVDLMLPVCSALASAHDEGVVHRDLKPENVFLARTPLGTEIVKVLDFGISHIAQGADDVRLTATNSVIGTPRYMSPEQTRGARNADARSDQYSIGVMIYECLTGSLPYDGDSFLEILEKMATKKIAPPSTLRDEVPRALESVVMKTLSKDPSKRFATMRELGIALLPFASPKGRLLWEPAFAPGASAPREAQPLVLQRDTTVKLRAGTRSSWRAAMIAVAALATVGLAATAVWWLWPSAPEEIATPLAPLPVTTPVRTAAVDDQPPEPPPSTEPRPEVPAEPPIEEQVAPEPTGAARTDRPRRPRPHESMSEPTPERRAASTEPTARARQPEATGEASETRVGANGAVILR